MCIRDSVASPPRVAQQVHHRCPQVQTPDHRVLGIEAPGLIAYRGADLTDQRGVPGARQADGLGKGRTVGRHHVAVVVVVSGPGHPMEGLCARLEPVSYTHLRAHETVLDLVCRLLLEKKKNTNTT